MPKTARTARPAVIRAAIAALLAGAILDPTAQAVTTAATHPGGGLHQAALVMPARALCVSRGGGASASCAENAAT